MMSHKVLLFGPLRDKFGSNQIAVDLPENCTVEALILKLEVDANFVKVAVDEEIVEISMQLSTPSEIALLPPVSGG